MNHPFRWTLVWLIMAGGLLVTAPTALSAQEKTGLGAVGRALGNALRALAGEAPPAPAADARNIRVGLPPNESDRQEYRKRLKGYGDALQAWLVTTCELGEEQRAEMKELVDQGVGASLVRFDLRANSQRPLAFGDCFPILFGQKYSAATSDFQAHLLTSLKKQKLAADQTEKLTDAIAERVAFRNAAFREYLVSIVDQELFLTREQRAKLLAQLQSEKREFEHPFYSFRPQSYYLPYMPLAPLIPSSVDALLSRSQQDRLSDLTSDQNKPITFQSTAGADAWYGQLEAFGIQQRSIYLRAVAVRVAYYADEFQLTPEQSRHLTVAGKGSAVQAVAAWKESTRRTIEQMEAVRAQRAQMPGTFAFSSGLLSLDDIDRNEIWSQAIARTLPSDHAEAAARRNTAHRPAFARALLALLDLELWLRPEQREPLLDLIEDALPRHGAPLAGREYMREIVLVAYPLLRTPEAKLREVLNEPQQAVWRQLKGYFPTPQAGRADYVQIPLKNNRGNLGFQLME